MKLKDVVDYDVCNYPIPSMFLIFPNCSFKCDKECGRPVCQNSALAKAPVKDIEISSLIERYLKNPLTHAVVCGGLEPFDSHDDLLAFIMVFRCFCDDTIVIYTGYTEEEIQKDIDFLSKFDNIIVKFGRFIPDSLHKFDALLGVELASDNQYAKLIGRGDQNECLSTDGGEASDEKRDYS